jgi:hypothetical protein
VETLMRLPTFVTSMPVASSANALRAGLSIILRDLGFPYPMTVASMGMAASGGILGQSDPNVLHHPLIFVIKDVAMQHEVADVAAIAGTHHHGVLALLCIWRHGVFDPQRVFPHALEGTILGVNAASSIILGVGGADIPTRGIKDAHNLERVDMDVEGMAANGGVQSPFIGTAELQFPIDAVMLIRLVSGVIYFITDLEVAALNLER